MIQRREISRDEKMCLHFWSQFATKQTKLRYFKLNLGILHLFYEVGFFLSFGGSFIIFRLFFFIVAKGSEGEYTRY